MICVCVSTEIETQKQTCPCMWLFLLQNTVTLVKTKRNVCIAVIAVMNYCLVFLFVHILDEDWLDYPYTVPRSRSRSRSKSANHSMEHRYMLRAQLIEYENVLRSMS